MPPTRFASAELLGADELRDAPIRTARPSAVARALTLPGKKAQDAAVNLGLVTVGDLLEHLPRERREARQLADLGPNESATVMVEVRSIVARPVRRRGMRPLAEAVVADASGQIKVAFFNQPWLAQRYPAGTRLMLHLRRDQRGRYGVQHHAPTDAAAASSERIRPPSPRSSWPPSTCARRTSAGRWPPCPSASAR